MREIYFIKQNKEKWLIVEQVIAGNLKKNPDELSSMYIDLINDLSFSQTYYSKSNTTVYLNHLSSQLFQKIYTTKRLEKNRLLYFFTQEVPLLVYDHRRYLVYAFLLFFLFVGIGVITSKYDPDFPSMFFGEEYINMTKQNIKENNVVGVYQQGSTWGTSIAIIFNNLKVGAYLFISGVLGGIGTVFYLIYNSIMVGTFQYFFYEQGVLKESVRGIWLHGTFEIFALVIEAMCGLILGGSILFPGTYSRLDSFKRGFGVAFRIFLSTVPFTIIAGIIEGYITRHALNMPEYLNWLIIFSCLCIIAGYYCVYPFIVKNKKNI